MFEIFKLILSDCEWIFVFKFGTFAPNCALPFPYLSNFCCITYQKCCGQWCHFPIGTCMRYCPVYMTCKTLCLITRIWSQLSRISALLSSIYRCTNRKRSVWISNLFELVDLPWVVKSSAYLVPLPSEFALSSALLLRTFGPVPSRLQCDGALLRVQCCGGRLSWHGSGCQFVQAFRYTGGEL